MDGKQDRGVEGPRDEVNLDTSVPRPLSLPRSVKESTNKAKIAANMKMTPNNCARATA